MVDDDAATAAAVKVIEQLTAPFAVNGIEVTTTGSLGVAMYRAKDAGRNAFRFFDTEMNNSVIEHLQLTTGIRQALKNREFMLCYQPQFELATGRIMGAETRLKLFNGENFGKLVLEVAKD